MNDYNPLISICVPIYGVEQYIRRCAISLFEQTYSNIEYIFVNDGTLDNSIVILENLIKQYPNRKGQVRIINHDYNRGQAAARNTAVNHARGEFIMHVDSDDWIEKDMVEKLVKKQQEDDADIVCTGFQQECEKRVKIISAPIYKTPREMTLSCLRRVTIITLWGKLIHSSLYRNYHLQCIEGVNMGEDWQIISKLYDHAQRTSNMDEPLYHYNCANNDSYTCNFSLSHAEQTWKTVEDLEIYFRGDMEYEKALDEGKLKIINDQLLNAGRSGNSDYINYLWKRYDAIKDKDISFFPLPYRIVFGMRNKIILTAYSKIAFKFKHL